MCVTSLTPCAHKISSGELRRAGPSREIVWVWCGVVWPTLNSSHVGILSFMNFWCCSPVTHRRARVNSQLYRVIHRKFTESLRSSSFCFCNYVLAYWVSQSLKEVYFVGIYHVEMNHFDNALAGRGKGRGRWEIGDRKHCIVITIDANQ